MEKKSYKEAINAYIQAIKYNEEDVESCYDLGLAYCYINQFPLAKKCFERVVSLDSSYSNAQYRLGQIALLYRDIENAEKYFLESIYGETEVKAYFQLAKIYMLKNNKDKAIMFINKAVYADNKYYKIIDEEPIFLPIKNQIIKDEHEENNTIEETPKEKQISEYLDNTYDLTKYLNNKDE